jgi:MFS family permease
MPIVSFLSFTQPYVLNEIVGIPLEEQGRVTGFLVTMQEIVALCLIGFVSALSDRFGRRPIYATGAFIAGIGFGLYGFATSEQDLYLYRFIYALGVTCVGAMIAVTAADYPAENSRGKLSGASGLLNGLGVGLALLLGSTIPAVLKARGFSGVDAGRYMLMTVAAICVITAIIMQLGLKGGTPTGKRSKVRLMKTLQIGLQQGRLNPRLIICYAGSGVGRADLTLVVTFVSLWLQQLGRDDGMSGAEALKSAGIMLAIIQGSSRAFGTVHRHIHRPVSPPGLRDGGACWSPVSATRCWACRSIPSRRSATSPASLVGIGQMGCDPHRHRPARPGNTHRRARLGDRLCRPVRRCRNPVHEFRRRLSVRSLDDFRSDHPDRRCQSADRHRRLRDLEQGWTADALRPCGGKVPGAGRLRTLT